MPNKSYGEISIYRDSLTNLKKTLLKNKDWKVVEIKHIEESEYIKDKVRVVIEAEGGNCLWDIFTQYKVYDGYGWVVVRIDAEDIKNEVNKIIKEVENEQKSKRG